MFFHVENVFRKNDLARVIEALNYEKVSRLGFYELCAMYCGARPTDYNETYLLSSFGPSRLK